MIAFHRKLNIIIQGLSICGKLQSKEVKIQVNDSEGERDRIIFLKTR